VTWRAVLRRQSCDGLPLPAPAGAQLGEDDVARACVDAWLATDGELVKHAARSRLTSVDLG